MKKLCLRVIVIFGFCAGTVFANLALNPGFEIQEGSNSFNSADWNQSGEQGRESWAAEWGSYGHAFYGWVNDGSGYIEQTLPCDKDATYYFRIRGLRESGFDHGTVDMMLRFFDNTNSWTLKGLTVNTNVNLSSPTNWTTYEIEADAPVDAGVLQMRCEFEGASNTVGLQSFKWDNVSLYNRRQHYKAREIVDEFSYDPDFNNDPAGKNRGNGFSSPWIWAFGAGNISDYSFGEIPGYPKPYGNKLHLPGNIASGFYRKFPEITNGTVYVAAMFNYGYEASGNWAGISLMTNGEEVAFFGGNSGGQNKLKLAIDSYGGTISYSGYLLNAGDGEDYLIVGKYDFSDRKLYTKAYYKTDIIPTNEPAIWDAEATAPVGRIPFVNGVRLASGGNLGDVYFDEVRVAGNWYDLLNNKMPQPPGGMMVIK